MDCCCSDIRRFRAGLHTGRILLRDAAPFVENAAVEKALIPMSALGTGVGIVMPSVLTVFMLITRSYLADPVWPGGCASAQYERYLFSALPRNKGGLHAVPVQWSSLPPDESWRPLRVECLDAFLEIFRLTQPAVAVPLKLDCDR